MSACCRFSALPLTALVTALLLAGCSEESGDLSEAIEDTPVSEPEVLSQAVLTDRIPAQETYRDHLLQLASDDYDITLSAIQKLNADISDFLEAPDEQTLQQARKSWRNAYTAYLQTLPVTAIPVDEPSDWKSAGLTRAALTETINPWPLEPGYIDYIDGYPYTGIVNDTTLNLSEGSLQEQHRFSDVSYVSLGFQVLEFLLWGENGQRPASDFNPATAKNATPDRPAVKNQQRRGEYLKTAGQMLQKSLQRLQLRWQLDNGFYSITTAVRSGETVINNSLISLRKLITKDLGGRYLKEPSSPYSNSSRDDAQAILGSLRELLLPANSVSGVRTLLEDTPEKITALENAFAVMRECLDAEGDYPLCQPQLLALVTAFDQAASVLDPAVLFPVNAWAEPVLTQPSGSGSQE